MKGGGTMPQIRPITDLRNTTEISDICHAKREPVFITKNGSGDLVVLSNEAYERLCDRAGLNTLLNAGIAEMKSGKYRSAGDISEMLKKEFGSEEK